MAEECSNSSSVTPLLPDQQPTDNSPMVIPEDSEDQLQRNDVVAFLHEYVIARVKKESNRRVLGATNCRILSGTVQKVANTEYLR
jgi:hypothetical protein